MQPDAFARSIALVLRNDPDTVRRVCCGAPPSFVDEADANGVLCLVAHALRRSGTFDALPVDLREQLLDAVRREQALELVRRTELKRAFKAFGAARVPALVFKGAALAYTHYPAPHLRSRVDTDLLVRGEDRAYAVDVLDRIGYTAQHSVERDAIFTQTTFCKHSVGGVSHLIDLHWKIANRPLFRDLLCFEELAADAVPVQMIGTACRSPGALHALLLACVHPVAHHHCEWPLIWLYDVSLLATQLSPADWRRFRNLAIKKKVSLICKRAFELTEECFGPTPWAVQSGMLDLSEQRTPDESSARYLTRHVSARRDLVLDISDSSGPVAICHLLLSHAFPDVRYMRETYRASGWLSVAAAYGRRMAKGAAQLLRHDSGATSSVN